MNRVTIVYGIRCYGTPVAAPNVSATITRSPRSINPSPISVHLRETSFRLRGNDNECTRAATRTVGRQLDTDLRVFLYTIRLPLCPTPPLLQMENEIQYRRALPDERLENLGQQWREKIDEFPTIVGFWKVTRWPHDPKYFGSSSCAIFHDTNFPSSGEKSTYAVDIGRQLWPLSLTHEMVFPSRLEREVREPRMVIHPRKAKVHPIWKLIGCDKHVGSWHARIWATVRGSGFTPFKF